MEQEVTRRTGTLLKRGFLNLRINLFILVDILFYFNSGIAKAQAEKPNIVMVLIDDLGYGEFETYGNTFNETPYINQLAKEGMTFTNAYASAPVCSPSRASIQTGQYTARHGIYDFVSENSDEYLKPEDHVTVNEALKNAGYYTGLIGKWHLDTDFENNPGGPAAHGYDKVIATETKYIAGGDYFYPYDKISTVTEGETDEFLPDRLFREADQFIRDKKDTPFFLALQLYSVHMTLEAPENLVQKYKQKYEDKYGSGTSDYFDSSSPRHAGAIDNPYLAAMLERIDAGIGSIVETLKELGIDENTLLVVTSDNGGAEEVANNGGLREAKTWLYEGGIRVPLIVRYPAGCLADKVNETPVSFVDFYPTFLDLAEGATSQVLDGVSMVPLFNAQDIDRDEIFWYYPAGASTWNPRKACVLRKGDYKLIYRYALSPDYYELYNLKDDPGEHNNLYSTNTEKAEELKSRLDSWMNEMNIPKWALGEDEIFDFEQEFYGDYGTKGNVTEPPNATSDDEDVDHIHFNKVENPFSEGINTTSTVGKFKRLKTGYWWGFAWFDFDPVYVSATETTPKYLHVMVRKPILSKVCVQFKGGNNAATPEVVGINTKVDEWEDMVFEISAPGLYSSLEIKADFDNSANPPYPDRLADDIDIYFDEIIINDDPKPRGGEVFEFEEVVVQDFEDGFAGRWGVNGNPDGLLEDHEAFDIIDNPQISQLNQSDSVGRFNRKIDGKWWAYAWFEFDTVNITNVPVYLHALVNKPVASTVCAQLKDRHSKPSSNTGEIKNETQNYIDKWQDLVFKITTPGTYCYMEFKPDFVNQDIYTRLDSDIGIFFDDIVLNTDPTPRHLLPTHSAEVTMESFMVYPTVTYGNVNIKASGDLPSVVSIYDINGSHIRNEVINGSEAHIINMYGLKTGVYLLTCSNYEEIRKFKILKL
ncbi:sulfatase-like hydrolase/transferase [Saccharicrinis sp. FJH2]|uniref:sulfatase n=1 Tax=Saccharicrinis sp. FJH65 TaxID=3344659 RepID=UPI0035F3AA2E